MIGHSFSAGPTTVHLHMRDDRDAAKRLIFLIVSFVVVMPGLFTPNTPSKHVEIRVEEILAIHVTTLPFMYFIYRVAQNKPDYLLLPSWFCISTTKHVSMIMYV